MCLACYGGDSVALLPFTAPGVEAYGLVMALFGDAGRLPSLPTLVENRRGVVRVGRGRQLGTASQLCASRATRFNETGARGSTCKRAARAVRAGTWTAVAAQPIVLLCHMLRPLLWSPCALLHPYLSRVASAPSQ